MSHPSPKLLPEPFDAVRETEYGYLAVRLDGGAVSALVLSETCPPVRARPLLVAVRVLEAVCTYLNDGSTAGLPPLQLQGTAFQRRVWDLLRRIPRGATRTYGDVARDLGSSARAVGGACRANPVLILVPCHRVVAKQGAGGFAGRSQGYWPRVKRQLLATEGVRLP